MPPSPLEVTPEALSAELRAAPPVLVDVRESWEVSLAPFPNALHIPLGELSTRGPAELDPARPTVLICHHGVRSLQGALILRGAGFGSVRSLRGGTDLWSQAVDPKVRRY